MGFRGHGSIRFNYAQGLEMATCGHAHMEFRAHGDTGTLGLGDMAPLDHLCTRFRVRDGDVGIWLH